MSIHCHINNNKAHYKGALPTEKALKTWENWKTAIFREIQFDLIFYVPALAWLVHWPLYAFFNYIHVQLQYLNLFFF